VVSEAPRHITSNAGTPSQGSQLDKTTPFTDIGESFFKFLGQPEWGILNKQFSETAIGEEIPKLAL
jgi:hypothetical protein